MLRAAAGLRIHLAADEGFALQLPAHAEQFVIAGRAEQRTVGLRAVLGPDPSGLSLGAIARLGLIGSGARFQERGLSRNLGISVGAFHPPDGLISDAGGTYGITGAVGTVGGVG